jgi:hypothetical protein
MASTHGGMRRILKRRLPVQRYIELAVKAGSYKSPSTRPNYLGLHDDRNNNKGFMTKREREESMKMRRGIIDYPTEHEILSLNPPLPTPPRTPVRIRKKLLADKRKRAEKLKKERMRRGDDDAETAEIPALDTLVKSYLRRHEDKLRQGMSPSQSRREEEYYSKFLLGQSAAASSSGTTAPASQSKFLSPSSLRTAMGRKSMLVENAYAFALRQQQIMLQGGDDEKNEMAATAAMMTEQDSIERVEQLLREEARANRQGGRKTAQEIEEWRTETKGDDDSTVPSILHDRPRSIRALNIWSSRLQSIPYSRWTIGAATALDHWIAREVLQMDENTWQLILEGGGTDAYVEGMETLPGGETKMGLMDRMRDIVTVRGALFPETLSDGGSAGIRGELAGELDDELSETDKSIDELLASLGSSVDDEDGDLFKFDDDEEETAEGGDNGDANDEQIESIMDELQVWRERNDSSPYESWDNDRKGEFDVSATIYLLNLDIPFYFSLIVVSSFCLRNSNGLRSMLPLFRLKLTAAVLIRMLPASLCYRKDQWIVTKRKNSGARFALKQRLSCSLRITVNMQRRSYNHLMNHQINLTKRNNPFQSCKQSSLYHLNASYKRFWILVLCAQSLMNTHLVRNAISSSINTLPYSLRDWKWSIW